MAISMVNANGLYLATNGCLLPVQDSTKYNLFLAAKVRSLMHCPFIEIGHSNPDRWAAMYQSLQRAGLINSPLAKSDLIFRPELRKQERLRALLTTALQISIAAILIVSALSIVYLTRTKRRAQENERRYKGLFDDSPISIWEEDFSDTKIYLDQQLSSSLMTVRALLQSRPDIVHECARRVRILNVNRAALSMFKTESKEALIDGLPATFTDASFNAFREELIALTEGHEHFQTEAIVKTLLGTPLHVDVHLSVLPSARQKWDRVVVLLADVTERKRAETESSRYKTMISLTNDMMAMIDTNLCYLTVNDSYAKAFNKKRSEFFGKPIVSIIGETIFEQIKPRIQQCLTGKVLHSELVVDFPATGHRHLSVNQHPTYNAEGEVDGLFVYFHDLTQLKRLEAELILHRDNLERLVDDRTQKLVHALAELEAFSYSVSHDLRAPLRSILGFAAALKDSDTEHLSAEGQGYLQRIQNSAQKMTEQIDGMLSLSRITRTETRYTHFNVCQMVAELAEKYQKAFGQHLTEVIICPDVEIYADHSLIEIALDNLIANAFKFSSRAEHPLVEFKCEPHNGGHILSIRDNGVGYDMQHASKLFTVFHRLHTDYEGTGIGLATVKRVALRHGAKLWAESAPMKGATFYLSLPSEQDLNALLLVNKRDVNR